MTKQTLCTLAVAVSATFFVGANGCEPAAPVGTFQVRVVASSASSGTTSVFGKVYDAATPESLVWTTKTENGACKVLTPRVPVCNPGCGTGICVDDNKCQANPTAKSVGAVRVTGLNTTTGTTPFNLTEVAKSYQVPGSVTLAYPPFAENAAIRFVAAGGEFPGFTLDATGIKPLIVTSSSLVVQSGSPLTVAWTAGANTNASIYVKLDLSHHGGIKGKIECKTADTGSLTIAAPLITELVGLGLAGYPTIVLTRKSTGTAQITAGSVELAVLSDVEKAVTVPGLRSCTTSSECPAGQTCRANLTCG
jgi:hypothetical protein